MNVVLLISPVIHYNEGYEQMRDGFIEELVWKGFYGLRYNIGTSEQIAATEDELFNASFFTVKHENARRSLSINTCHSHLLQSMTIMFSISMPSKFFD